MSATRFLIIGGGLAGNEAARYLTKLAPGAAITLVGEEPHLPYDRPPLSKDFLKGAKPRADLFFDAPDYYAQHGITVLSGQAVTGLDLAAKAATLANGQTLPFDRALLATGGRPVRLRLPGGDLRGVHYLRRVDDAEGIAADAVPGRAAVIIGGGFIGMELAATLTERGVRVTVIEDRPHIWARFLPPELAAFFQQHCGARGIQFRVNQRVQEILGADGRVRAVKTSTGDELPCDLVCVGVGIVPNVELASAAGLKVENGIVVDEHLQTSHPDVFAAGDVCNYPDPFAGRRRRVEHWTHAKYCGRLAAQNLAGQPTAYDLLSFVWSDLFDLHLKFVGDEFEHDRIVVRGPMTAAGFSVLFLKAGRVRALFAINQDARAMAALRLLVAKQTNVAGREGALQDPLADLRKLA